jgi:hypothetical protein
MPSILCPHFPRSVYTENLIPPSQIQALGRIQKTLPMQPGHAEQRTYDYVRYGITTLFAALEILTGKVTGLCKSRHRHHEFLAFLKHLARSHADGELRGTVG